MSEGTREIRRKIINGTKGGKKYADAGKLEKAFECYHNAFTEAEQLQNDTAMRSCAFNLGALCVLKRKDYKQGVEYLEKAVDKNGENGDNAEVFFLLGQGYEQLQDGNKAYENYSKALKIFAENKNIKKEVDTLEKMVHVSEKQNKLQQVLHHLNELVRICDVMNNGEGSDASLHAQLKRLKFMVKKAHVLKKLNDVKKSKDIAQDCLEELLKLGDMKQASYSDIHDIFNELGLLLMYQFEYKSAVECYERVLELVPNRSQVQMAVIKQNLGAAYNFMGKYRESLTLHQEAAELHAAVSNRASQGHCYCNKAYAHFQLGAWMAANVAFHLALEASKEAGDIRTQWQALEGLGNVALVLRNFEESAEFFKQAFTFANKEDNKEAQERILHMLRGVLCHPKYDSQSHRGRSTPTQNTAVDSLRTFIMHDTKRTTSPLPGQSTTGTMKSGHIYKGRLHGYKSKLTTTNQREKEDLSETWTKTVMESGAYVPEQRNGQPDKAKPKNRRVLKIRRSGSLRKFKKVALGISVDSARDMDDIDEDTDEDSEEQSETSESASGEMEVDAEIHHAGDTILADDEQEKAALQAAMRQQLTDESSSEEETESDSETEVTKPVASRPQSSMAVQQQKQTKEKEVTQEEEDEEESETSSSDTDEEPPQRRPPSGPSKSPSPVRTYESPVRRETKSGQQEPHYVELDFETSVSRRAGEKLPTDAESRRSSLTPKSRNVRNFFYSSDESEEPQTSEVPRPQPSTMDSAPPSSPLATPAPPEPLSSGPGEEVPGQTGVERPTDPSAAEDDSTIYQTVQPSTSQSGVPFPSTDDESPAVDNPHNLSRAHRENIMFQYHQQQEETLTAEQKRSEESVDEKNKKSKACIVM